jgi:cytochrome c2
MPQQSLTTALRTVVPLLGAGVLVLAALAVGTVSPAIAGGGGATEPPAGQRVFLAQQCNFCHAVSTRGIESKAKSKALAGPDLAGLAERREVPKLGPYLQQQAALDGKKHKKGFKGSDEELQTLLDWLGGLEEAP